MVNIPNLPPNPSTEDVLSAISNLIQLFYDKDAPLNPKADISKEVKELGRLVGSIKEQIEIIAKETNIDPEKAVKELQEEPNINTNQKQFFKRIDDIKTEGQVILDAITAVQEKKGSGASHHKEKSSPEKQGKERRKLFKSIGSDKKWIPL